MMLEQPSPEDYIIATGQSHTLTQFVETAFQLIGKDWRDYVTVDKQLVRPTDIACNKVDASKAAAGLGWKAQYHMREVIAMMLQAEIASLESEAKSCKE
jgi:GDPmannose 4,6-dehydratase